MPGRRIELRVRETLRDFRERREAMQEAERIIEAWDQRRKLGRRAQTAISGDRMTVNVAKFEESTEIVVDSEVEAPAVGWALNYVSVNRVGNLVAVHIEATNNIGAAALITTLQADFAPGDTVTDATGNCTIDANGAVSFTASRAASAKRIVQLVYQAGQTSP